MITAIIPCYNAEPYLAEAIESVLAQTRPADEIFVVDDCSTDGSAAIAARYPVQVLRTAVNSGHAAARNVGTAAARGDLIAWLDADDTWEPQHLHVVAGLLERHPTAALAYGGLRVFGLRSGVWDQFPCLDEPKDVFWECFRRVIVPAMGAVMRKDCLTSIGGCDASIRIAPDFDLWLRLAERYPFICTTEITLNYRWHAGQISANRPAQIASTYATRHRLWEATQRAGNVERADEMAARMRTFWESDLRGAWRHGRGPHLRTLAQLGHLVPDSHSIERRWALRARVPGFVAWSLSQSTRPLRAIARLCRQARTA